MGMTHTLTVADPHPAQPAETAHTSPQGAHHGSPASEGGVCSVS